MQLHYCHPSRLNPPKSRAKYVILIAAVICLITGCAGLSVQSHISKAQTSTGSIVQHANRIDQTADTIQGNEHQKQSIKQDTKGIRADAATVLNNLADAIRGDSAKDKELKRYRENPLVWVAMFVWTWGKLFLILLVGGACLYPLSFILGLFNPSTAAWRISQALVRALPAANPVRWAHDLLGRNTVSVPAAVVPKESA